MKPNYKVLRVVLGAAVGAALWAGCATNRNRDVANEPAGAAISQDQAIVLDPNAGYGENVDTHPEWRTGWNMAFPNPPFANPTAHDLSIALDQPTASPPETR
jgi:hypothetical protein